MSTDLRAVIQATLKAYRTQHLRYGDGGEPGDHMQLADVFSPVGAETVEEGLAEIELLADALWIAITDAGAYLPTSPYHYTEDGDYPEDERDVLISIAGIDKPAIAWLQTKEAATRVWKFGAGRESYLDLSEVYAWQELPPKATRRKG